MQSAASISSARDVARFPTTQGQYAEKPEAYFARARADIVAELPANAGACILEIGCGSGITGSLAKAKGKAGRYVGVELFPAASDQARDVLDEVHTGDVEHMELPWRHESFDAVILSEVLEHLCEPWALMKRLAPLVRRGGRVYASSPNVSHWRVLRELSMGRFPQADQGVFDRTHMRWFTPATYKAMMEDAGFVVDRVGPLTPFSTRTKMISRLSGGRLDHLFMTQIMLVGHRH